MPISSCCQWMWSCFCLEDLPELSRSKTTSRSLSTITEKSGEGKAQEEDKITSGKRFAWGSLEGKRSYVEDVSLGQVYRFSTISRSREKSLTQRR